MGGHGSGRYCSMDPRPLVEDCLILDVNKLIRDKMIQSHGTTKGILIWNQAPFGDVVASAEYNCAVIGGRSVFTLLYATEAIHEVIDILLPITLDTTPQPNGGVRWWLTCPVETNGHKCRRRVGKLYLPPGELRFGCRACHGLTYVSCRESHRYDRLLEQLGERLAVSPNDVKRLILQN